MESIVNVILRLSGAGSYSLSLCFKTPPNLSIIFSLVILLTDVAIVAIIFSIITLTISVATSDIILEINLSIIYLLKMFFKILLVFN